MGFWDDVGSVYGHVAGVPDASGLGGVFGVGGGDPSNPYRNALTANGQQQGQFGQSLQGQYQANQAGINGTIGSLQAIANGQNSVSAEQLRQGLQQQQAAQMSMAAGAAPQNQVMAARTAANNMARAGYGMSGEQAVAGLQERQNALNALAQMQLGQAGQNMNGALGAYGLSNNAYGTTLQNPQKTWGTLIGPAIGGAAGAAAKFA